MWSDNGGRDGHYRILSLATATAGGDGWHTMPDGTRMRNKDHNTATDGPLPIQMALTNQTNDRHGGGRNFAFTLMVDTPRVTKGCVDADPLYCFKVATGGHCESGVVRVDGTPTPKTCHGTARECCKLSCAKKLTDDCAESVIDVLGAEPVATMNLWGKYRGSKHYPKDDTWTVM